MAAVASGPEQRARSWLSNSATPSPIWNFPEAIQFKLKKEGNIDAEIEVPTKALTDGHVGVQAKIGPNIFHWEVNLNNKTVDPKNELTVGFMGLIVGSERG